MLEELNVGRFEIHSEKNYISVYRLEGGVFVWYILCNKKINSNFMKLINLFGPAGRALGRGLRTLYFHLLSLVVVVPKLFFVLLLVQIGLALYFSLTMTIFIYLFRFLTFRNFTGDIREERGGVTLLRNRHSHFSWLL